MLHLKKSLFALPHLQRTRYKKKKRGGNEKKGWDVLWGLKNKKCFDASSDPGLAGSRPRGADRPQRWQYLECSRDLDAWRYILIHGRLARHSQEVKKKNRLIKTHKQTTHRGPVDLQSLLQVHSFQSSSPRGVH